LFDVYQALVVYLCCDTFHLVFLKVYFYNALNELV